ncbi:unnamed protein product [Bursaphelenchus xylophilus]|uniref:(pine wood nematode) hypothetical protein n=1 Tax=Bursaphelenchus xylophilus TaxID=6326 RepID=A0A1I7RY51_BURXY|nr:unnamed protein product [Bursaphelenchus xylophilus]CAG9085301.1 unnamed protein product [Bursaphelenchus xylophilus]
MGNSESTPLPGGGSEGYHVLRVQENSPGQLAGLEAFFDFIVAVGNKRLDRDDESFKQILNQSVDKPLELTVYNSKSQTVRQTQIIPSNSWGGQGILGISIRFCSFDGANQNVWHIISVQPNSPAYQAGLQADSDYVLGAESVLQQADDLIALVQANIGKPVKLYVYNVETDAVREVTLTPNDGWGGEGCLGCDIGYGYLHRIPSSVDRSNVHVNPDVVTAQKTNIPQPGFTGIPQLDQIQSNVPTTTPAVRQFPDPSEFSVPASAPNVVPQVVPQAPTPVDTHVESPVGFSEANTTSAVQHNTFSVPQTPATSGVRESHTFSNYESQEPVTSLPPSSVGNFEASSYPNYYNDSYQYSQTAAPPPSLPPSHISAVPQPAFPPTLPPSSSPAVPQVNSYNGHGIHQQFPPQSSPSSLAQNFNQMSLTADIPINTSSYQPYLAYGAPAPPPTFAQEGYGVQGHQSVPPPAQPYYQPPASGLLPQTSLPQPPNLNFPMPPLSSLGINNLVPPMGQFTQSDPNQRPHF